jgi:hypothetical protein
MEINGKVSYYFHCKTKAHAIEACFATMHCDICDSKDHFKPRCPKFRASKTGAVPCGYAVEGLRFFPIPNDIVSKNGIDARSALIRVLEGELLAQGVVAELQRLIPGDWVWKVEEAGLNSFRTVIPSKNELLRMVEWGVVQAKSQKVKLQIEERMMDSDVKFVLPTVWVQFTGLPSHLRDYLVTWAVGTILGVTKDVDMVFTREFDICRMQVLVMNPNLIPSLVNVVIGENLYELKFQVELAAKASNPQPMETDHQGDEGSDPRGGTEGGSDTHDPKSGPRNGAGGSQAAGYKMSGSAPEARAQGSGYKKTVFILKFLQGPVPITMANGS